MHEEAQSKNSTAQLSLDDTLESKSCDDTKPSHKPQGRITPYKAKDLVPINCSAVTVNPSLLNTVMEK